MKIIDQTPLLDANGQLSLINRIKGMLQYGFSWPENLKAQAVVIAQLNKALERGYTLFRNQPLGASGIIVPLILVGSSGIYVLEATPLKGYYRARGEEWGVVVNEKFQPASINLIARTARLAKILQLFLEKQGLKLSAPVEPVLMAADPGLHIDSVRPAVRVVMSDAIDRFAAGLLNARPVYNAQMVSEFVERIQKPRSSRPQPEEPISQPESDIFSLREESTPPRNEQPFQSETDSEQDAFESTSSPSRLRAILSSPKSDALIENVPSGVDFALEDEPSPTVRVSSPPAYSEPPAPAANPAKRRVLGLTIPQLLVLITLFLCWLVAMALGFIFIILPQI